MTASVLPGLFTAVPVDCMAAAAVEAAAVLPAAAAADSTKRGQCGEQLAATQQCQ
jgi:hypothetical protein